MTDERGHTSRRRVLGGALVALAGLVGGRAATAGAAPRPGFERLRLYGRNWHAQVRGRRFGEQPATGDRMSANGELLERPNGRRIGEFWSSAVKLDLPFGGRFGSLELHTFSLEEGTILGMGTASGEESVFAVIGGTGRYTGARGSYIAHQRAAGLGGEGSAEFDFSLTS